MKRVLVFGGKGLIGKAVMEKLNDCFLLDPVCVDLDTHFSFADMHGLMFDVLIDHYNPWGVVNCTYPKDWIDHIRVTHEISMAAIHNFKRNGGCSLINLGSIYGLVGPKPRLYENEEYSMPPEYSFVKGGTIAFTRSLATLHANDGIRCNTISPGGVFDGHDGSFFNKYTKEVPMQYMAWPRDVANVVAFLLSDDASYITGQNIVVDGGYTSW